MRLLDDFASQLDVEHSYFRQHLLREDIGRIGRLVELARAEADVAAFVTAGLKSGWTPEDRRTHELRPALEPLLTALHARARSAGADAAVSDDRIADLWRAFEDLRMHRLVGCLSRVPKPDDAA